MDTRQCTACAQIKPLDQFRGNRGKCRQCESDIAKENARKNSERRKAYHREYNLTEAGKARRKRYLQSEHGRKKNRESANKAVLRRWHTRPDARKRMRVRAAVFWAIKSGKLIRPEHCECCKTIAEIEAHHWKSYEWEDRFEVQWLCSDKCHPAADKFLQAQLDAGIEPVKFTLDSQVPAS